METNTKQDVVVSRRHHGFSLFDHIGALFVLLFVGTFFVFLLTAAAVAVAYVVIAIVFFVTLAVLLVRSIINLRDIYVDSEKIRVQYRLGLKRSQEFLLGECLAFFPYVFRPVSVLGGSYASQGLGQGIIILTKDQKSILFASVYGDDISKLIMFCTSKGIKNTNELPEYRIDDQMTLKPVQVLAEEAFRKYGK